MLQSLRLLSVLAKLRRALPPAGWAVAGMQTSMSEMEAGKSSGNTPDEMLPGNPTCRTANAPGESRPHAFEVSVLQLRVRRGRALSHVSTQASTHATALFH